MPAILAPPLCHQRTIVAPYREPVCQARINVLEIAAVSPRPLIQSLFQLANENGARSIRNLGTRQVARNFAFRTCKSLVDKLRLKVTSSKTCIYTRTQFEYQKAQNFDSKSSNARTI